LKGGNCKVNILFAHNVAKIGGAEKVTLDIVSGISKTLFSSHLICPENGPLLDDARSFGTQASALAIVQPSRRHFFKSFLFTSKLIKYLKSNKISVVHTGDIFIARALLPAIKKLNLQLICHMHFPPDDGAIKWVFNRCPEHMTFVYCSKELKENIAGRISVYAPHAEHVIIHNGVDVDFFKKDGKSTRLLPTNKLNIGIVANLQERKGHDEFIESAAELMQNHDNLAFHIIGGDVFGESRLAILEKKVEALDLVQDVTFHGQVNNVKDYLNQLDIYVCSSYQEAFPISILEAMAMSLPIASTNVNGIPEALNDGDNALLYPPKDVKAQTAALAHLISSADVRETLSQQARNDVVSLFSKRKFIERVEALYKGLSNHP